MDPDETSKYVQRALELGADYCDIRFEDINVESIVSKNSVLEQYTTGNDHGAGIRVLCKGNWGFVSTNNISYEDIEDAVKLAKLSNKRPLLLKSDTAKIHREKRKKYVSEENLTFLREAEKAMGVSPLIKSTKVALSEYHGLKIFMNSEDTIILEHPYHIKIAFTATAKENALLESYISQKSYITPRKLDLTKTARRTSLNALKLLKAKKPPRGKMDVILGEKVGGLFAHEAVGHAAEADHKLVNNSFIEIGYKVPSEITLVDDPTAKQKHGSYTYDDEGVRAKKTRIIDRGVFKSFLHSRETASRMNKEVTGNGRAESFRQVPVPRMSNTSFEKGDYSREELFEDIKYGLVLYGFVGGEVNTTEGNFMFTTTSARVIRNGALCELVKRPTVSGLTLSVLGNIDGIGKKRSYESGYCMKKGQTVRVGIGSPLIRVRGMVVG